MYYPILAGISGTNGKTTTYLMLEYLLGNNLPAEPHSSTWNIREIRNHTLEENYSLLIITNITHPLPQWQKKETWNHCLHLVKNMDRKGVVLLNADDPHCLALADKTRAQVVSFAVHCRQAMVTARDITREDSGKYLFNYHLEEEIQAPGGHLVKPVSFKVKSPLRGEHNLYNTLAAVTSAIIMQKDPKKTKELLDRFQGIRRQREIIQTGGLTILDDRAENPPALEGLLKEVAKMKFKRLVILTGINSVSSSAHTQQKASILCSWAQKVPLAEIIFTRGYRFGLNLSEEEKGKEEAFLQYFRRSQIPFQFIPEGVDALHAALEITEKNDLLLLAGKGCMEQISNLLHSFYQPMEGNPLGGALNPS